MSEDEVEQNVSALSKDFDHIEQTARSKQDKFSVHRPNTASPFKADLETLNRNASNTSNKSINDPIQNSARKSKRP